MDGKEWLQSITHAEPVAYGSALLPLLASAAIKARVIKGEESRGTLMVVHPFLAAAFSSRGSATARDEGQAGLYTLLECCFFFAGCQRALPASPMPRTCKRIPPVGESAKL